MQETLLALLAAIPLLLYLWLMWRMDRYEREPVWLILLVFGWGALGAIAVTMLASFGIGVATGGSNPSAGGVVLRTVLLAPIIEEPAKALIFLWLFRHREFDNVTDGFVYGAAAGLGFALTENFSYYVRVAEQGNGTVLLGTIVIRTLYSALLHAGATSIVGAAFGLAKYRRRHQARVLPWIGLAFAVLIHAIWNGLLVLDQVTEGNGTLTIIDLLIFPIEFLILFLLFQKCIKYEEGLLERQLMGEVPEDQLPLLANYRKHGLVRIPEGVTRKEYLETATRLAFRKEQAWLVPSAFHEERVHYWRDRLRNLSEPV